MPAFDHPTISFAPPTDEPDPRRTYIRNPEELEVALTNLPAEEPVVIGHSANEQIDLSAYTRMLERAQAAGRDVVLVLETR